MSDLVAKYRLIDVSSVDTDLTKDVVARFLRTLEMTCVLCMLPGVQNVYTLDELHTEKKYRATFYIGVVEYKEKTMYAGFIANRISRTVEILNPSNDTAVYHHTLGVAHETLKKLDAIHAPQFTVPPGVSYIACPTWFYVDRTNLLRTRSAQDALVIILAFLYCAAYNLRYTDTAEDLPILKTIVSADALAGCNLLFMLHAEGNLGYTEYHVE